MTHPLVINFIRFMTKIVTYGVFALDVESMLNIHIGGTQIRWVIT